MIITRPDHRRTSGLYDEVVIDNFAGGGGASMGIELALGRAVDVAVNHDALAVAMHRANHPDTLHLCQDVFSVAPEKATGGRAVGLAWFSPDCTFFSKARGAKPIRHADRKRRDLAWVVIRWAERVRPRVIMLENVEEFRDWGPLDKKTGKPCPLRKGSTFKRWKRDLQRLGYEVDHRELRACDYGAPTIRKRLFLIARCDGQPITWPEKTHGDIRDRGQQMQRDRAMRRGTQRSGGGSGVRARHRKEVATTILPYRTAAECIDWSIPCPSIFMTAEEAKEYHRQTGTRVIRPLKPKTLERIANGVMRFVVNAAEPFIVTLNHSGRRRPRSVDEPMQTVTAARDAHALVTPFVSHAQHGGGCRSIDEPLHTVTASRKDQNQIIAPLLVPRYGERDGQQPRSRSVEQPLPVIVPTGNGASLVSAALVGAGGTTGTGRPRRIDAPLKTIKTDDRQAVVSAFLAKHNGKTTGQPLDDPLHTIAGNINKAVVAAHVMTNTSGHRGADAREPLPTQTTGQHHAVVAAVLNTHRGENNSRDPRDPMATITSGGSAGGRDAGAAHALGVTAVHLAKLRGTCRDGQRVDEPAPTITSGGLHEALIYSFLQTYYGNSQTGQAVNEPIPTIVTKDRISLVTVNVNGIAHFIADIGMRMLRPRELFRAQSFPDTYIIDHGIDERGRRIDLTQSTQVALCGNSVPPEMVAALVRANVPELIRREVAA